MTQRHVHLNTRATLLVTLLAPTLSLALACSGGGDDTDTDDESTVTEASTSEGETDASTEATTAGTGGETEGATGSTTGDPTTGDPTDATTTAGDGVCDDYCALLGSCGEDTEVCLEECEQAAEIFGAIGSCEAPITELYACVAGLDCAGYEEHSSAEGDFPCKAEKLAYEGDEDSSYPPCAYDDPPEVCVSSCETFDGCGFNDGEPITECYVSCAVAIGGALMFGEECKSANEATYLCYGAATCAELEDGEVCLEEEYALEAACDL